MFGAEDDGEVGHVWGRERGRAGEAEGFVEAAPGRGTIALGVCARGGGKKGGLRGGRAGAAGSSSRDTRSLCARAEEGAEPSERRIGGS